jgi:hypothetical protein
MASVRQDINVGLLVFIGLVGAMVLLIIVLGVQAWFAFETDLIIRDRYRQDENRAYNALKSEQLANIGDPIGNSIIYSAAIDPPVGYGSAEGYRWTSDTRETAVIPIHEAMAQIVRENGGNADVTAMLAADREPVSLTNNAYVDPDTAVQLQAAGEESRSAAGASE